MKKEQTKALAVAKENGLSAVVNTLFATKTPKEFIKSRPGANGMVVKYVEIGYVTNELNKAFGIFWEFRVIDKHIGEKQLWIQGQLTIKDPKSGFSITKESFGGADIKISKKTQEPLDIANDLKAAVSDCTKKCASMFGIAADVFFKEQDSYDQMENVIDVESGEEASTKKIVMAKFFAVAAERGIIADAAKDWIKTMYNVQHMDELTISQMEKAINSLEKYYEIVEAGESPRKFGQSPLRNTVIDTEKAKEAQIVIDKKSEERKDAIKHCANTSCNKVLEKNYFEDKCKECRLQDFIDKGKKNQESTAS